MWHYVHSFNMFSVIPQPRISYYHWRKLFLLQQNTGASFTIHKVNKQPTSICLSLKMLLMLLLKAAPENIEVIGYVKSRIVLNTEFITYGEERGKRHFKSKYMQETILIHINVCNSRDDIFQILQPTRWKHCYCKYKSCQGDRNTTTISNSLYGAINLK